MNELKISTQKILEELATRFPNMEHFRKSVIEETANSLGYTGKDWSPLCSADTRVKRGTYDLSSLIVPLKDIVMNQPTGNVVAMAPQSVVNKERTFAKIPCTGFRYKRHGGEVG